MLYSVFQVIIKFILLGFVFKKAKLNTEIGLFCLHGNKMEKFRNTRIFRKTHTLKFMKVFRIEVFSTGKC